MKPKGTNFGRKGTEIEEDKLKKRKVELVDVKKPSFKGREKVIDINKVHSTYRYSVTVTLYTLINLFYDRFGNCS